MEFRFVILYLVAMIYVVIFTLIEHKFLAIRQSRRGPNVNSLGGVLNSVFDALKLLQKDCKMEDRSI